MKKQDLPAMVQGWCENSDAWIVGGAALPATTLPRDIDVMIPWERWPAFAKVNIPSYARPNSNGGWKFDVPLGTRLISVDVWPDKLDRLASRPQFTGAWHPLSDTRLIVQRGT